MTQRRRNRHRKRRVGRRAFLIGLGGSVSAALTYYLLRSIPAGNNAEPAPSPQAAPNPALRGVAGGVGELSRICRDGFFLRKRVPGRCRRADGQLPVPWAEHRHCTGAALRGCALPEQPLPMEPPVHRRAGAGPGL